MSTIPLATRSAHEPPRRAAFAAGRPQPLLAGGRASAGVGQSVATLRGNADVVPQFRKTELSFDMDPVSHALVIRVIDAKSRVVLRSTSLKIPGSGAVAVGDRNGARGLTVDTVA